MDMALVAGPHNGCRVGLLINFNVPVLKNGIKRMVL